MYVHVHVHAHVHVLPDEYVPKGGGRRVGWLYSAGLFMVDEATAAKTTAAKTTAAKTTAAKTTAAKTARHASLAWRANLPAECWHTVFAQCVHYEEPGHLALVGWRAIRQLADTCKELLQCEHDYLQELRHRCVERAPPLGSHLNYLPAMGRVHWGCVHSVWRYRVEKNTWTWHKKVDGTVKRVKCLPLEQMHASLQEETKEFLQCLRSEGTSHRKQDSTWDWAWRLLLAWAVFFDAGGRAALSAFEEYMHDLPDAADVDRYPFDYECEAVNKLVEAASVARPARFSGFALFWLLRGNPASWEISKLESETDTDFMTTCVTLTEHDSFDDHDSAASRLVRLLCRRHPHEAEGLFHRLLCSPDGKIDNHLLGWSTRSRTGACSLLAKWACVCEAHGRDEDADTLMGILWASELMAPSDQVTSALHKLHALELTPDLKAKLEAWRAAFPAPAPCTWDRTAPGAWPLGLFDAGGRILLEPPRPLPTWLGAVQLGRCARGSGRPLVQRSPFGLGAVQVARQCAAATHAASVFVAKAEAAAASLSRFSAAAAGAPHGADRKATAAAAALKEAMAAIAALTASVQPEPYQQLEYHRRTVLAPSRAGNELLARLDMRYRLEAATEHWEDDLRRVGAEELWAVSHAMGLGTPRRSRQLELDDLSDWWEEATWLPDPSDSEESSGDEAGSSC